MCICYTQRVKEARVILLHSVYLINKFYQHMSRSLIFSYSNVLYYRSLQFLYIIMCICYIIDIVFKLITNLKYTYNIKLNTSYYNVHNEFHIYC